MVSKTSKKTTRTPAPAQVAAPSADAQLVKDFREAARDIRLQLDAFEASLSDGEARDLLYRQFGEALDANLTLRLEHVKKARATLHGVTKHVHLTRWYLVADRLRTVGRLWPSVGGGKLTAERAWAFMLKHLQSPGESGELANAIRHGLTPALRVAGASEPSLEAQGAVPSAIENGIRLAAALQQVGKSKSGKRDGAGPLFIAFAKACGAQSFDRPAWLSVRDLLSRTPVGP